MRIRIESPFFIHAGPFKPAHVRRIESVGHTVHRYRIGYRDLDAFLREIYRHYASRHERVVHRHLQYQWYAELTIYSGKVTTSLNLSYSRLYHNHLYRLQFRQSLNAEFGFYPAADFWECDTERGVYTCSDIRTILNAMVKGVTK
jgi:hypothetical protein